jgi:hypothetical protein
MPATFTSLSDSMTVGQVEDEIVHFTMGMRVLFRDRFGVLHPVKGIAGDTITIERKGQDPEDVRVLVLSEMPAPARSPAPLTPSQKAD